MIKISGGYVAINPNFVISDIPKKNDIDKELDGVIAIVKNILLRGVPTKPSCYLESKLGKVKKQGQYYYTISTKDLKWEATIKGGRYGKPALDFYNCLRKKYPFIAACFRPECRLNDIHYEGKNVPNDFAVDFYSPFHKLVIEIDGSPHNKEEQIKRDAERDKLIQGLAADAYMYRIKDSKATQEESLDEIKRIINNQKNEEKNYRSKQSGSIPSIDKKYMYIIRLQLLLLEIISKGYLNSHNSLTIALKTACDEEDALAIEAFDYAHEDLKLWFENLYMLLNKTFDFPNIKVDKNADVIVDIDLYNNYDESLFDSTTIKIRNDYFPYDRDMYASTNGTSYSHDKYSQFKNYYTVATSDLRFPNVSSSNPEHKAALEFFLRNIFGHEEFRPNQLEIITNGLNPKNGVVGLLPTGSGKSVCFQLVSFLTPGITLVVSPLKLLMDDQIKNLYRRNLIMTAYQIHSEKRENIYALLENQTKILYVTPEKFFSDEFNQVITNVPIGQIAIDEVHCLSEWGHEFRTSYLLLLSFLSRFSSNVLLMGTSATASPRVINDIEKEFSKLKPKHFKRIQATSIKRPELTFRVIKERYEPDAKSELRNIIGENSNKSQKTLVFCAYKKTTQNLANYLNNYNALKYYSGDCKGYKYTPEEKEQAFESFSKGNSKVMIATKAFGMGIDVPDIRETVHYDIASSVESLYQEMGRAGRDGVPSKCTVILTQTDNKRKNIDELIASSGSIDKIINKLKYEQKDDRDGDGADEWLNKYGAISKQLCLLLNDNEDYVSWGEFVYQVYLFLNQLENSKNFFLYDFYNFFEEKYPDVKIEKESKISRFDKAVYKLYTLGIIDLWSLSYSNGNMENPQYTNISFKTISAEIIQINLINHIHQYDFRYTYKGSSNIKDYITALCKWDNETFLRYRWESLKTLYKMVVEFKTSDEFAQRLENFFMLSDELNELVSNSDTTCVQCMSVLHVTGSNVLKDQLANLSAEYQNNTAIDFMQGMIAIQNGNMDKPTETKFKVAITDELSKKDSENSDFVEECLAYFRDKKSAQKRFLVFISDNFPKKLKHKEIKKVLTTFDESESEQLLDRPQYNRIYASLEKLKLTLGDNK